MRTSTPRIWPPGGTPPRGVVKSTRPRGGGVVTLRGERPTPPRPPGNGWGELPTDARPPWGWPRGDPGGGFHPRGDARARRHPAGIQATACHPCGDVPSLECVGKLHRYPVPPASGCFSPRYPGAGTKKPRGRPGSTAGLRGAGCAAGLGDVTRRVGLRPAAEPPNVAGPFRRHCARFE